jgi:hypothetical protein
MKSEYCFESCIHIMIRSLKLFQMNHIMKWYNTAVQSGDKSSGPAKWMYVVFDKNFASQ